MAKGKLREESSGARHSRPGPGTRTGRVWEIADERTRETGCRAKRADVIECCVAEGINRNTASTQYQHWRADFEASNGRDGELDARAARCRRSVPGNLASPRTAASCFRMTCAGQCSWTVRARWSHVSTQAS